ncbi:sugar phosphate isomerase/epimerase [Candidatus Poribacteria bacterium]|nr:sugar phosphate isomerase/epimerase [Candidatus Poribacteria bacterium]
MKLGFLTGYSEDIVKFAGADPSFECLEISGPPNEWIGDTDEAHAAREKAKATLTANGLTVASFLTGWPSIRTSKEESPAQLDRLGKVMDVCDDMGGAVLTGAGPMGYDPGVSLEDNVARYKEVYSRVAEIAEAKGVKIGFENWPGRRGPFGEGGNLAVTPEAWGLMFDAVPSKQMGLEFDPSHLLWQWIDVFAALDEFSGRINVLHAKDTEIFESRVRRSGVFRRGGWWRYRLPGFAKFDWHRLFAMLHERGFDGPVVIEHEDPVFNGERRLEGFHRCGKFLRQCILD